MMLSANAFDVTSDQGAVDILHDLGVDPWVVEFGPPDRETGGLERMLSDHVVALSRAIDSVHAHTGYGTATAAALGPGGTIYCLPQHHGPPVSP